MRNLERKLSINVRLSDADQMCIHTLSVLIHGLSQEGKFSWNSQSNKSSTIGTIVVHCNALVEDILLREFQGNLKHNFLELSEQYIYPLLPTQLRKWNFIATKKPEKTLNDSLFC